MSVWGRPRWSPDGSRIVFSCIVSNTVGTDICVTSSDGTGFAVVTSNPLDDLSPDWSPAGAKIAYSATTDDSDVCADNISVVTLVNSDGSAATQLGSGTTGAIVSDVMWSP